MKFDKSKAYSALNADEVKIGSKGYFSDSFRILQEIVENEDPRHFSKLCHINSELLRDRFVSADTSYGYTLFYLVEEPEIKEVTAEEWNNRPHVMRVWNDCYEDAYNMLVVHIRSADNYHPVVAVSCKEEVCCFKHCAEIVPKKTETAESKAEKHYRPYKDADEFIADYKRRFCPDSKGIPTIWVKNVAGTLRIIGNDTEINYLALIDTYTYLDGTPCGIEE